MIDWVSFSFNCHHDKPINGGRVVSIKQDGTIEWDCSKRLSVQGSFESSISVRSDGHNRIDVSGNIAKFFQGHNLFGSHDLLGLVYEMISFLLDKPEFGLFPNADDAEKMAVGDIQITRVDVTESFNLGSESTVFTYLRAAEHSARMPFHGRGQLTKGSTLYWGKHSRRWSLKLYAKHAEIIANSKHQPAISNLPHVIEWSKPILRAELTLRSMELKRRGLASVSHWRDTFEQSLDIYDLLRKPLSEITMTTTTALADKDLSTLKPTLRVAYQSWATGTDLRAILSRPTFYRYRKELLKFGVDISVVTPVVDCGNVVPLVRVIEFKQAQIPDWAYGTELFFQPRVVNLRR